MKKSKRIELLKLQNVVLNELARHSLKNTFYWTGGTALAILYLQHRESEDIDLFSDNAFDHNDILSLVGAVKLAGKLKNVEEKRVFSRYLFLLKNHETLRLEFVHYDFKPLKKRKKWKGVLIDSLTDIAANKTMSLIGRYEPKDAFDIYYLIHEGKFTPAKLVSLAKKKFGMGIPLSSFWERGLHASKGLNTLTPLIPANQNQQRALIKEIQTYFEIEAARELRKHLFE